MWSFLLSQAARRHMIAEGRVGCPVRGGDVDLEACLRCRSLRGIAQELPGYVLCDGATSDLQRPLVELLPPAGS